MVLILNEAVRDKSAFKDVLILSFNSGFDEARNFYPWFDEKASHVRKDVAKQSIKLPNALAQQNYPEWG